MITLLVYTVLIGAAFFFGLICGAGVTHANLKRQNEDETAAVKAAVANLCLAVDTAHGDIQQLQAQNSDLAQLAVRIAQHQTSTSTLIAWPPTGRAS